MTNTPSIETVSDALLDDMIERIDRCRKVRDELELLAALRELRQMRGERSDGVFGRDDLPAVMVYTAKILRDMTHHEYEGPHQMVMFGDHQRAMDKLKTQLTARSAP